MSEAIRLKEPSQDTSGQRARIRYMLDSLFPTSAEVQPKTSGRRLLSVVVQTAAVGLAVVVLLERVPGMPSWDTIYAEDYFEFFTQALQQPWHLFTPYGGYEELLPRLLAQVATYFPLPQVSRLLAGTGAFIAAGSALFVFHASAGHIRSIALRALLASAVVLMPIAPMELVDSGDTTPWYLMLATFWALLWRPKTRTGMALAALVAFGATSGEVICFLFVPLVAARLFVLHRLRDHAVTAGWVAGCLLQVPALLAGRNGPETSRLTGKGPLGNSLAFYAHDTVLPVFGWHLAWWLQSLVGRDGATAIMTIILAVILRAILVTQPRNRPFVIVAVLTGIVFSVTETTLNPHVTGLRVTLWSEWGSRYSVLPIFLLEAAAIVGVDYLVRRRATTHGWRQMSLRPAIAVAALVGVLGASWVADFRYAGFRSKAWDWGQIAARWQSDCEHSPSGEITEKIATTGYHTLPCDRIHT